MESLFIYKCAQPAKGGSSPKAKLVFNLIWKLPNIRARVERIRRKLKYVYTSDICTYLPTKL